MSSESPRWPGSLLVNRSGIHAPHATQAAESGVQPFILTSPFPTGWLICIPLVYELKRGKQRMLLPSYHWLRDKHDGVFRYI